jgi:hypothetical protein
MDIARRLLGSRGQLLREVALLVVGGVAVLAVSGRGAHVVIDPTPTPVRHGYAAIDEHHAFGSSASAVGESTCADGRRTAEPERVERPQSTMSDSQRAR